MIELLSGENVRNRTRSANQLRGLFYLCPVCGNVIRTSGEAVVSCCGITLPPLEAEAPDPEHSLRAERVEDEYWVTLDHPMTKAHYVTFIAGVSDQGVQLVKLYPEWNAEARFRIDGVRDLYACCNQHGLFRIRV